MNKRAKHLLQFLLTLALISSGVVGMQQLRAGKPQTVSVKPVVAVPGVSTTVGRPSAGPVVIRGEGNVRPVREMTVMPQVNGKVAHLSPALVNGGRFVKGETLIQIETVDYHLAVTLAMSRVRETESSLQLIQAESDSAREEWNDHYAAGVSNARSPSPLVMKLPQLSAARARLEANRADLKKAQINLERTRLTAPFDGQVTQCNVDIGQYVAPGQSLARLNRTDVAEIVVPMANDELFWFDVPGFTSKSGPGAGARVHARIAGENRSWKGRVVRTEGKMDERTRMINIVVRVQNPYATQPPLAMGTFANVEIIGRPLNPSLAIPRAALRSGDTVWVVEDGRLRFQTVDVLRIQNETAWIRSGIGPVDRIVVSGLANPTAHMAVRDITEKEPLS